MRQLVDRLAEPSTWAGLSGLALAFGIGAESWQTIAQVLAGLFGLVAMLRAERSDRT